MIKDGAFLGGVAFHRSSFSLKRLLIEAAFD
jgi:hypothetical protein